MMHDDPTFGITETNRATVEPLANMNGWRMTVPPGAEGYANAQVDDYSKGPAALRWAPGSALTVTARFSASGDRLVGTAGFGFWNAPFGPGVGSRLRLPQATWFFFASSASNLPLAPLDEAGNGWFASTIDAGAPGALLCAPFAPLVLLLNQFQPLRRLLWPIVRRRLGISYERIGVELTAWQEYRLVWFGDRTLFFVNGTPVLVTPAAPHGPLGFVSWMDNQHMTVTPRGRIGWGVEAVQGVQWLEIRDIRLDRL